MIDIIQVKPSFNDPIPDGEYEVPGIKPCYRLIIKDNEGVAIRNIESGRIVTGTRRGGVGVHRFLLTGLDGKSKMYTVSRLVLCVRSGIGYEQIRNVRFLVNRSGLPVSAWEKKRPDSRMIGTIDEIEKTIGVVKAVQRGDVARFHTELDKIRTGVVKHMWCRHSWDFERLNTVVSLAEEMLYNQMLNLNVLALPKLSSWYAKCILTEYMKNIKEVRHSLP